MRVTTTIVLLVLALALGAVYWVLSGGVGQAGPTPVSREPLLPPARWEQITLQVGRQPATVLRRMANTSWELIQPTWWPADPQQVQSLIDTLASLHIRENLGTPGSDELSAMSLSPPAGEVRLIGDQGGFVLHLGDVTPAGNGYVQTDTGLYAITQAALHEKVYLTNATTWRAPTLSLPTADRLDRIEVRLNDRIAPPRAGFNPFMLRRQELQWSFGSGSGQRADAELIASVLTRLTAQKVVWIPDANNQHTVMLRADNAQAVVTFIDSTGRQYRLSIGRAADLAGERTFARLDASIRPDPKGEDDWREGPILTLARDTLTPWTQPGESWRDRRIIDTPVSRIASVRLLRGERVIGEATRDPSGLAGQGALAEEPDAKLESLVAIQADHFDVGFMMQAEPAMSITVEWGLGGRYTVDVTRFADDAVFLRRGERVAYRRSPDALPDWLGELITATEP